MISIFHNYKQKNASIQCIDIFNDCNPFLITKLDKFCFFIFIKTYNYYKKSNYIHHETGFIEIVEIFKLDFIFGYHVAQQCKLIKNHSWIFVQCFLIIVKTVEFNFQ